VVALAHGGYIYGEHVLPWLNRLSDVLFVLSRAVESEPRPARED
jgi:cob(I)alamin adenosyltransferase